MKALINGVPFTFTEKLTVLEAVRKLGFFVPTLCAYPTLESTPGSCGLCIVKIKYP
ncbi:2Fe-2S iron-sulfur cluster-binding protein, partial [Turicimonas muris]